jgi:hypothetical protein
MNTAFASDKKATTAKDGVTYGKKNYYVAFEGKNPMDSNFGGGFDDEIKGMQPGDTAVFTLRLINKYNTSTDWYMLNEVIKSLEDYGNNRNTSGGAYEYYLNYFDHNGKKHVLYSSDTVGGEDYVSSELQGLNEATNALDKFFYLDTLAPNEEGSIELTVSLEGETQGNAYQDTKAQLQMQFAVELPQEAPPAPETPPDTPRDTPPGTPPTNPDHPDHPDHPTPDKPTTPGQPTNPDTPSNSKHPSKKAVKTGDELNLVPYVAAMGVSGVVLLVLAIYSLKKSKKNR